MRRFCRVCGSPVVNGWDAEPDGHGLAMGTLDDDPGVRPSMHEFVGAKAPWHDIADSLPQHHAFSG